jgi:hypothetical protein
MTSQPHFVQPPRIAVWLISLFALAAEAESILGDLLEEFSVLASKSGMPSARIGIGDKRSRLSHGLRALVFALPRG